MVEILNFDNVNKERYKNILAYIDQRSHFSSRVSGYCVYLNGRSGILLNDNGFCELILNGKKGLDLYEFTITLNGKVGTLSKDGYEVKFDSDQISFTNSTGVVSFLRLIDLENPRENCAHKISFEQYNQKKDIKCEYQFSMQRRNSNEKGIIPIHEIDINHLEEVYIDTKYSEMGDDPIGFIGKNHIYFGRYNTYSGNIYHSLRLMRTMGIGNYRRIKELPEMTESYCRAFYINRDYEISTGFPFCKGYSEDELKRTIESMGFESSVPEFILDVYNGNDSIINGIQELCEAIHIEEVENKNNKRLIFAFDNE